MPRLFVCVWIPEEMKQAILDFQKKLSKLPIEAKFVERENLHLTLTFLGERTGIEDIKKSLEKLKGFGEFPIFLSGLKIIPSLEYIRVIGVNVKDDGTFTKLIKNTVKLVGGEYYESSKMTLCRVKSIKDKQKVVKFLEENKDVSFGKIDVKKVDLVESKLTPKGPLYSSLFEVYL
ncbi:MAG: RNA 2',3'-cyclic phosphodiesterase [Candidatus Aenigmarchaeota archaeon]|nr:RNA 2',3'-cyclic phosphodiesterase [Candidatus Aenigmarchaeota archaeon]